MFVAFFSTFCCLLLFCGIILTGVAGHWLGRRRLESDATDLATATVDAAVLSLVGLLIAFTFSNAYARYETRRQLIVDEVNAIGTGLQLLDLLPAEPRAHLRKLFKEYAQSRFELWTLLPDKEAAARMFAHSEQLQKQIWSTAVAAVEKETQGDAGKLLLPALNTMTDITTTRLVTVQAHPPLVIFFLLGLFSLAAGGLIGFGMGGNPRLSYLHLAGFAATISLALLVILDIEYPRHGTVRLDREQGLLRDIASSIE